MMLVMQWLSLCFAAIVHAKSNKITLYVGSMAPLSGNRSWWGAGITAAMKMAFDYINNRTDILPSYQLTLLANDTKGETGLGNKILFDYIRTGKPSLILGPGRSNVALSVADTAKYWKIIQISASAESGDLSDEDKYPFFFRTISSISASKSTFVALAKTFHWKRVSILFFSRDMYIRAAVDLKEECERNNITVLSYGSYIGSNDAMNQLEHIKNIDARIIFAFLQRTTTVMCLIYKNKLYGQKYGWVVHTPDSQGWWNRTYPHLGCTADQVTEAAEYAISIDHLYLSKANASSISGLTPQQFSKEYKSYVAKIKVKTSVYGPFGFDAAWMAAIALNSSTEGKSATRRDLLDIHEEAATEEIKENLLRARFLGVTGDVKLEANGDRSGSFEVFQLTGSEFHLVALHDAGQTNNLTYYDQGKFQWTDGKSPSDGVTHRDKLMELSEEHFIVMCVVATFGILLCFGFLHFNIVNRNKRCVKMSSPNINSTMIIGCILAYVSVILFSVDGMSLTGEICMARVVALDYGFTIAFGSMFSKTWRVHRITRKLRVRRKAIQDIHLLGMIFMFLFVDTVILIVWYMVDPLRKTNKYLYADDQVDERNGEVIFRPMIYLCTSNKIFTWMLLVFGFKGILLLFGLFLAWETRKVEIATLNDSRYIGMAVYNVCTICAIGVPLALVIYTQHHNLYFYVVAISIVSCTTLTLCLVFVPKIRLLKKSNTREASGIFPTNGIKCEKKFLKGRSESLTTKELGNEIEWLRGQLKKFQTKKQEEDSGRTDSQFVSKPSCYV